MNNKVGGPAQSDNKSWDSTPKANKLFLKPLEKIDSENDYEDALRGSVIGVFQMVIAGKESVEHLIESAAILKSIE